jgi:nucleoside-diphosphate-sugar epimerase
VRVLNLGEPIDTHVFKGVSCVVHTAWDLRETDPRRAWECNVNGSKRLLEAALGAGVQRFIFISSMSAYFGTKQDYGLMKLAVERAVLESHQIVVRPGLVYGGEAGGMVLTLTNLARLPVIPVFRGTHQFTLHIDDFLAAMVSLVSDASVPSSVIGLAYESPTPFKEIMQTLAAQSGNTARTVTVPWHPLLGLLRIGERLRIPLPVRSDSLLGLVRPAPMVPGRDVAASIGLTFRGFSDDAGATFSGL